MRGIFAPRATPLSGATPGRARVVTGSRGTGMNSTTLSVKKTSGFMPRSGIRSAGLRDTPLRSAGLPAITGASAPTHTTEKKMTTTIRILQSGNVLTGPEAEAEAPDSFSISSREDLENVPTPVLLKAFNGMTGKNLKKFADRDTAVDKSWEAITGQSPPAATPEEAPPAPKEDKPSNKGGKPGKPSGFIGKRIIPTQLGIGAIRSDASRRTRSFGVIRENPGLTFEQYVERGGSPADLSILVNRRKHAMILDEGQDIPTEFPKVADPKGVAERRAARAAEREKERAARESERAKEKSKKDAAKSTAKGEATTNMAAPPKVKKAGKAGRVPAAK
jgi:hypothetical protein